MKIKRIFTSVVVGASLLASVGAASAATTYNCGAGPCMPTQDLNVYGASAQFLFFKTEFANFLNAAGCTPGASLTSADGKHFVQQATCGTNTVNYRVSSKASYDGPLAVDGNTTNPSRDNYCENNGGTAKQRRMLNVDGTLTCQDVTIGASDVMVADFQQVSNGALLGPLGGAATSRNFQANPFVLSAATRDYCRPLAIPFAFFAHNDITTTGGATISNITRAEAQMMFSGIIKNWADLQAQSMNSKVVQLCLRHAGSGTHATMDAFMRPVKLVTNESTAASGIYFNDGSSDLMKCVNGSGAWTGAGAIGYADADQVYGSGTSYPNVVRLSIDGVQPLNANVDDFSYPFATVQNMYTSTTNAANNVLKDLCIFASQPSLITAVNSAWSASCNMKHIKDSNFGNFRVNSGATGYHNANCN